VPWVGRRGNAQTRPRGQPEPCAEENLGRRSAPEFNPANSRWREVNPADGLAKAAARQTSYELEVAVSFCPRLRHQMADCG
jgi:hypothetical protein